MQRYFHSQLVLSVSNTLYWNITSPAGYITHLLMAPVKNTQCLPVCLQGKVRCGFQGCICQTRAA